MKNLGVLFFLLLVSLSTSAQGPLIKQWDKRFGGDRQDYLFSLNSTNDNGCVLVGAAYSGVSGDKTQANWDTTQQTADVWIVKVDHEGNKEWDKRFGGFSEDGGNKIQQTLDGGYAIGAMVRSGEEGDKSQPSWGADDYWLIKTDGQGNKEWDRRFGGSDDELLFAMQQTRDSGYIIGGISFSTFSGDKTEPNLGATDYWVVKIGAGGQKVWDKSFGGDNRESLFVIKECLNGGYLLAGISNSDSSGDVTQANKGMAGTDDVWIVKINNQGNKLWDKRYGTSHSERIRSMQETADKGFVLGVSTGYEADGDKTELGQGNLDYWLIKTDSLGNKQWDKVFGGLGEDELKSLSLTADGGYLLSGNSQSPLSGDKTEANMGTKQPWLVKLDSLGYKQWDKTIMVNPYAEIAAAMELGDRCYIVGCITSGLGGEKTQPSQGGNDYWILKFCMEEYNGIKAPTGDLNCLIQVWPNPFTSDITIALTGEHVASASFTITNLMGQVVYQQTETNLATGYTKMLDLSYLPNGVYFVAVSTGDKTMVERVVKE